MGRGGRGKKFWRNPKGKLLLPRCRNFCLVKVSVFRFLFQFRRNFVKEKRAISDDGGWIGVAEKRCAAIDLFATRLSRNRRGIARISGSMKRARLESRLLINPQSIERRTLAGCIRSCFYESAIASATSMELSSMAIYIRDDGQCLHFFYRPVSSSRESRERRKCNLRCIVDRSRATRLRTSFEGRPSNANSIFT